MLKLNKGIHINILCVFAVVFVCVYLYYTIADVKKIAVEVKKHGQDINNIITSLATVTKELGELKKKAAACSVSGGVCSIKPAVVDISPKVEVKDVDDTVGLDLGGGDEDEDDEGSVNTDDVKNLLGDIPDEDGDDNDDDDVVMTKDYKSMSLEDLKNEKYEDLKEYCKKHSLSVKGTKESLIQRIKQA